MLLANHLVELLSYADYFFQCFKRLFADLILDVHDIRQSQNFMRTRTSYQDAYKVIEMELGFFYDLFYIKAYIAYSSFGLSLRSITFCCILVVLAGLIITPKGSYSNADVLITYVLLIGAVILEIIAVVEILSSDQMLLKLGKQNNSVAHKLYKAISKNANTRHRWSNKMAQYNFIRFCLKDRPTSISFIKKNQYKDLEVVPDSLKKLVFQDVTEKIAEMNNSGFGGLKQICTHRGDWVLKKEECWDNLGWSIEAEFDNSILLWHIATDLCYYSDLNKNSNNIRDLHYVECKASRVVSNYMIYLMVMGPFMLPNGIGEIRWRDTCAEATRFFEEFGPISNGINEACTKLYEVSTDLFLPLDVKGDRSKSVLFDACRVAKSLECLESEKGWERSRKWKLICKVWIEMLCYAASECRWSDHAEQLRKGGELLTHVWLLMAHLGITQQFQISRGEARTTLNDSISTNLCENLCLNSQRNKHIDDV